MVENAAWWFCIGESHRWYMSDRSGTISEIFGSISTLEYVMTSGPNTFTTKLSGFNIKNKFAFFAIGKSSGTVCSCKYS